MQKIPPGIRKRSSYENPGFARNWRPSRETLHHHLSIFWCLNIVWSQHSQLLLSTFILNCSQLFSTFSQLLNFFLNFCSQLSFLKLFWTFSTFSQLSRLFSTVLGCSQLSFSLWFHSPVSFSTFLHVFPRLVSTSTQRSHTELCLWQPRPRLIHSSHSSHFHTKSQCKCLKRGLLKRNVHPRVIPACNFPFFLFPFSFSFSLQQPLSALFFLFHFNFCRSSNINNSYSTW